MGKVSVNITKKEYGFIDPNTGQEMSPAEFNQKHSTTGMAGLRNVLSGKGTQEEKGKNN